MKCANLFGYGEIKPLGSGYYDSSMTQHFPPLEADNFQTVQIQRKEDIWTEFQDVSCKDRAQKTLPVPTSHEQPFTTSKTWKLGRPYLA